MAILNSNQYADKYGKYHFLAAFGAQEKLKPNEQNFEGLAQFFSKGDQWLFGHLSYDLKNQLEDLESGHAAAYRFGELSFFKPKHLLVWKRGIDTAEWWSEDPQELENILNEEPETFSSHFYFPAMEAGFSKEEYLRRVEILKEEIRYGNIYEINFCQQFTATASIDPQHAYWELNKTSSMPFSAFYKQDEAHLICASPERFMAKRGEKLICQPIKGTARRSKHPEEDEAIKRQLQNDLKEQTENVMIVDLMRNDLSRTAARRSVEVEELFGVYTFPQVHQLISTVVSKLDPHYSSLDAIKFAFPMGSMTGAPKIKAMQLIDQWEGARRELYSGSVGYFDPEGDFDLNVVIRSLLYQADSNLLSLTVGGAITDLAHAESEYEECLLKAKAIFDRKAKAKDE